MKIQTIFRVDDSVHQSLPLVSHSVSAGFPSPADDFVETTLDLNRHLVKHPSSTFFVRVSGDSMKDANIYSNDILVVDRSVSAKNNSIVVAVLNGELTVKRFRKEKDMIFLLPENDSYETIVVNEEHDFSVWGVVTYVIHQA